MTLQKTLEIIEKRDFVTDYSEQNHYNAGLLSRKEWLKYLINLRMSHEFVETQYENIINTNVEQGICPFCNGRLEVKHDDVGVENQSHVDTSIICSNCGGF